MSVNFPEFLWLDLPTVDKGSDQNLMQQRVSFCNIINVMFLPQIYKAGDCIILKL